MFDCNGNKHSPECPSRVDLAQKHSARIVDTVLQRNMIALFSVLGAELEGSTLALLIFPHCKVADVRVDFRPAFYLTTFQTCQIRPCWLKFPRPAGFCCEQREFNARN